MLQRSVRVTPARSFWFILVVIRSETDLKDVLFSPSYFLSFSVFLSETGLPCSLSRPSPPLSSSTRKPTYVLMHRTLRQGTHGNKQFFTSHISLPSTLTAHLDTGACPGHHCRWLTLQQSQRSWSFSIDSDVLLPLLPGALSFLEFLNTLPSGSPLWPFSSFLTILVLLLQVQLLLL